MSEEKREWFKEKEWWIADAVNYDELLSKYGPEGLYLIAEKLKRIANKDIEDAFNEHTGPGVKY